MFSLKGKTAIITGGGSGIGRAICLLFAKQEANVILIDRDAASAEYVRNEITESGGRAVCYSTDVSEQEGVFKLFSSIGKIDILVNNAGIAHVGKAHETTVSDFERVYAVNIRGAYNCIFSVIPLMQRSGGGVILNLASIAAHVGIADRFAYSVSKGAVAAMTLSVAKDYLESRIRCNSISPARVHTPFVDGFIAKNYPGREVEMFKKLSESQPVGRMAEPEEVASIALYLCSDEASFITGNDFAVDGGFIKLNS